MHLHGKGLTATLGTVMRDGARSRPPAPGEKKNTNAIDSSER